MVSRFLADFYITNMSTFNEKSPKTFFPLNMRKRFHLIYIWLCFEFQGRRCINSTDSLTNINNEFLIRLVSIFMGEK